MFNFFHRHKDGPIEVLHVLPSLGQGGTETVIANLIKYSDQDRFHHHILVLNDDKTFEGHFQNLPVDIHFLSEMTHAEQLRLAKEIDVLHVPNNGRTAFLLTSLARMMHKTVIMGLHSVLPPDEWQGNLKRTLYKENVAPMLARHGAHEVVCCTDRVAQNRINSGFHPENMRVINNGIDTKTFTRDPSAGAKLTQELGLPEDAIVVGISARYDPMKDIPNFIAAAKIVKEENPTKPIYFLLCGSIMTPENKELTDQLKQAGIFAQTRLLGVRLDMENVYSAMDVLVSSSRNYEALSMALLEATACGCLCVSTNAGDHEKLMKQTGGICVPTQDSVALAEGVNTYLHMSDSERREKMQQGRAVIIRHYNVKDMVANYEKLFSQAAQQAHHKEVVVAVG